MTIIEQIKAEIERLKAKYRKDMYKSNYEGLASGYKIEAYNELLSFLSALETEKPMNKDCNGCPHCVDRKDQYGWHFKGCFGGPYKGKFIAEIDECPLKQEQPEVDSEKPVPNDLEEAAEEYADCNSRRWQEDGDIYYDHPKIVAAFIAGAKWQKQHDAELIEIAYNDGITIGMTKQKEQMMDEWLKDRDGCFWDGVNEGKKAMKEQMMKEAEEYEVGMHGEPIKITFDKYVQRAKGIFPGDKVRVIICKKDD